MLPNLGFWIGLFAFLALLSNTPVAFAGTTGALAGRVTLDDNTSVTGATVTASSPSESKTTKTGETGYFVFVSLIPDTYSVTVSKDGYDTVVQAGNVVFADSTRRLNVRTRRAPKTIGVIPVHAKTGLVQPGMASDVYVVDATTADKLKTLGGGGNSDNYFSALAGLPGVFIPPGQSGWIGLQTIFVRGGMDSSGIGYELDGIPVTDAFDTSPVTNGSTLGQEELQLYSGGAPLNAEAEGLEAFVNQVIKSGTSPGFATAHFAIGTPSLYNQFGFETGGATGTNLFTYYLAASGYEYAPRVYNNSNGAGLSHLWGTPFDQISCSQDPTHDSYIDCYQNLGGFAPNGALLGPYNMFATTRVSDRESIINLHFKIPHRHDAANDDVQVLYDNSLLLNPYYSSYLDWGKALFDLDAAIGCDPSISVSPHCPGLLGSPPVFFGGFQYQGPLDRPLANGCLAPCNIVQYQFPSSQSWFGPVPVNLRDSSQNGEGIFKLQYQHNIGTSAYFRIYAYNYYNWWFLHGPNTLNANYVGCCNGDYELTTHTRGVSATYEIQLNPKHLLTAEASGMTASIVRDNNTQMFNMFGYRSRFAVLVDANAPNSGFCFRLDGTLASCEPHARSRARAAFLTYSDVYYGDGTGLGVPDVSGLTCDPGVSGIPAGPCEWLVVENGPSGLHNTVRPIFNTLAISDQFRPSEKLQLTLGLRFSRFSYATADTRGGSRNFWFNAWNQNECAADVLGAGPVDKADNLEISPAAPCPSGFVPATMYNVSPVLTYHEVEPRVGGTYSINSDNVLRFSHGVFAPATVSGLQQYNTFQQNLPEQLDTFLGFYQFGFRSPSHNLQPTVSYNTDLSWEHRFTNTDVSFKLTPFLRRTKDQLGVFALPGGGVNTGLPFVFQTNTGLEFELQKGQFSQDGLTALFSYTYTYGRKTFKRLPDGGTVADSINFALQGYNAYTVTCGKHPKDPRCGGTSWVNPGDPSLPPSGATGPCFDASGIPLQTCGPTDIANPYWNAPPQPLIDPNVALRQPALSPTQATLVLNYKHHKFAISPAIQYFEGSFYSGGFVPGIDPAAGCSALSGGRIAGDPRYPYGAPGGLPYDATTCQSNINIPDPFTGKFDLSNAFRQPNQLLMHVQLSYEATPRTTFGLAVDNLIDGCFGGTRAPWTLYTERTVCGYYGNAGYAGNFYNPNSTWQRIWQFPYNPIFGTAPRTATFDVKIKL